MPVWSYSRTGWSAHSGNGAGKLHWWVARYENGVRVEYLQDRHGNARHFGANGAARRARQLNKESGVTYRA